MKESDALTKWCPQVRSQEDVSHPSANRLSVVSGDFGLTLGNWNRCIASDCMMWVSTDNECDPQERSEERLMPPEPKCYPAGRCGLIK